MYGKITVGAGTPQQKELSITDFLQCTFKDGRHISVCDIEGGGILVAVENPKSSGREPQQTMYLSKESFVGLFSAAILFVSAKGEDVQELINQSKAGNEIQYSCSKNLKL